MTIKNNISKKVRKDKIINVEKVNDEVEDVMEVTETVPVVMKLSEDAPMTDKADTEAMEVALDMKSDQEILAEINYRLKTVNKNAILLRNIPKNITRRCLKEMVPELITCRFPVSEGNKNKGFAFIQLKNQEAVQRYIKLLDNKKVEGHSLSACQPKEAVEFSELSKFDLSRLFFNGLNHKTKSTQLKEIYSNCTIQLPQYSDFSCKGHFYLSFNSEEEARETFLKDAPTVDGVKIILNFPIKKLANANTEPKFTISNTENLFKEFLSRFDEHKNRLIVISNIPKKTNIEQLKKLVPNFTSCKLVSNKRNAYLRFENEDTAKDVVKALNNSSFLSVKIKSHLIRNVEVISNIEQVKLNCLYVSNIRLETTKDDIQKVLGECKISFPTNEDGSSTGYCTAEFNDAEAALEIINKSRLVANNSELEINFCTLTEENKKSVHKEVGSKLKESGLESDLVVEVKTKAELDIKNSNKKRKRVSSNAETENIQPTKKHKVTTEIRKSLIPTKHVAKTENTKVEAAKVVSQVKPKSSIPKVLQKKSLEKTATIKQVSQKRKREDSETESTEVPKKQAKKDKTFIPTPSKKETVKPEANQKKSNRRRQSK